MRYTFDRFQLDPDLHRLEDADGRETTLRPQAFKVLEYLVRRAPSMVSREELLKAVWGHNALSVSGVAQAVREIRRALHDDASQPRIIATRHGCGYQFVADVTVDATPAPKKISDSSAEPVTLSHSPLATMAVFGLLLIGMVAGSYWFRPGSGELLPVYGSQPAGWVRLDGISMPEDIEARAAFMRGAQAMADMEWYRAAEQFDASLGFDAESVAARLGQIEAYLRAGYEVRARELIDHPALKLDGLSRRERLEVRALLARLSGDWNEVTHCMRSLTEFFPQQIEYHFGLFEALLASAPPSDARSALERIRKLLPAENPGARYYLAQYALERRDDHPADALAAAQMALNAAESGQKRMLYARSELAIGHSLSTIGRLAEAREAYVRAVDTMHFGQHESGRAEALLELAKLDLQKHRLERVRQNMAPACKVFAAIGNTLGMSSCTRTEGQLLVALGEADAARPLLEQSIRRFESAGDLEQAAEVYLELGHLQLDAGTLEDAEASFTRAGRLFERIGDRSGYAWVRHANGLLLQRKDMLVEARIAHTDAYVIFRGLSVNRGEAASAHGMANALGGEGKVARAEELLDSAIKLYRDLGDRPALADAIFDAGILALNSGQLAAAEAHLAESARLLISLGRTDRAAIALAELSRVYIDQARAEQAHRALASAAALKPSNSEYLASINSISGYLALLECDRELAARLFDASQQLREGLQDESLKLRSHLDRGRLDLERGRPDLAEASALHIVDRIDQSRNNHLVAEGFVVLVEALQLQGRINEAREQLLRVERLGLVNASLKVALGYQILLGKLDMVADPSAHLRAVRERANNAGYRLLALETDVALASKLLGSGQTGAGRELATAVMERARQTGILYVAERAMRLNTSESEPDISLTD